MLGVASCAAGSPPLVVFRCSQEVSAWPRAGPRRASRR